MKKMFTLILCLAFAGGVLAQEKGFDWGVKAGVKIGTTSGSKVGFFVGGAAEYKFIPKFGVAAELLYSRQSEVNFVSLPVMARFYATEKLSIEAGTEFNYVFIEGFNDTKVGFTAGATYTFIDKIPVSARYSYIKEAGSVLIGVGYKF